MHKIQLKQLPRNLYKAWGSLALSAPHLTQLLAVAGNYSFLPVKRQIISYLLLENEYDSIFTVCHILMISNCTAICTPAM